MSGNCLCLSWPLSHPHFSMLSSFRYSVFLSSNISFQDPSPLSDLLSTQWQRRGATCAQDRPRPQSPGGIAGKA